MLEYEAMGLAPHGQGARVILDGVTRKDGKLPVNPSGGLKSKGHPIGATGVSQHVMAAMQLSGTAGGMQVGKREAGRRVQHGRLRCRQLPEHPGVRVNAAQVDESRAAAHADRPLVSGPARH